MRHGCTLDGDVGQPLMRALGSCGDAKGEDGAVESNVDGDKSMEVSALEGVIGDVGVVGDSKQDAGGVDGAAIFL